MVHHRSVTIERQEAKLSNFSISEAMGMSSALQQVTSVKQNGCLEIERRRIALSCKWRIEFASHDPRPDMNHTITDSHAECHNETLNYRLRPQR
jgi:hypothetical protein